MRRLIFSSHQVIDNNNDQYYCKECKKVFKLGGYSKHLMFSHNKKVFAKIRRSGAHGHGDRQSGVIEASLADEGR